MRPPFVACAIVCLALLPAWSQGGAVPVRWGELLKNNPFTDTVKPEAPPPETTAQLELRGVLVEDGRYWFSVYDVATKKEAWVQKDEMIAAALVKEFDRSRDVLTLELQGKPLTLALKQPKILALPSLHGAPSSLASNGPASAPAVAALPPANEAKRLDQVAAEIRQRREERVRRAKAADATKA